MFTRPDFTNATMENLFPTFQNPGTSSCFQDPRRLFLWVLLLLRRTVAVMTLTHLVFDSLSLQHTAQSPTETTVQTHSPTHPPSLSRSSLSAVLMHAEVTRFPCTDVSSGEPHSHLPTVSSPKSRSISEQPGQARQEHTKHTPGSK